jgi:predicted acylesterase/phospholipase RssA
MVELMKSDDVAYDVIAGKYLKIMSLGASIGSLNGLLISSFEKGREKEASVKLTEIWKKITRTDVYYHWPYVSFIQGFFWQTSFLDNSPLLPFIEKHFKELNSTIKRKFSFGIAEAQTGKYIQIDERTPPNKIPYYIVAATSVPGLFPYLIENDKVYIDGGTVDNLNLKGAIERCREIVGDDDSLITIDTIMTNPCK